jgi:hypothetical protein
MESEMEGTYARHEGEQKFIQSSGMKTSTKEATWKTQPLM